MHYAGLAKFAKAITKKTASSPIESNSKKLYFFLFSSFAELRLSILKSFSIFANNSYEINCFAEQLYGLIQRLCCVSFAA